MTAHPGTGDGAAKPGPPDPPARTTTISLPARPASGPAVRGWIRRELDAHGIDDETADLVALLTSELTTNALRYGSSDQLTVRLDVGDELQVAVHDDNPRSPQLLHPGLLDVRGRGLVLIAGLANAWGQRPTGSGKWVWFTVDRAARRR